MSRVVTSHGLGSVPTAGKPIMEDLPQETLDALAQVKRHPLADKKDKHFGRKFGPFRNGDIGYRT